MINMSLNPLNRVISFVILKELVGDLSISLIQSPKSGHIVCNKSAKSDFLYIFEFQSPKSGHIVCNSKSHSRNIEK